jgi:hypothetical protein
VLHTEASFNGEFRTLRAGEMCHQAVKTAHLRHTPKNHRFETACQFQELIGLMAQFWRSGNSSPRWV